ncbi:MAG: hypothetical protein M3P84_04345 [Chloroflexota bacterium]|nr:hypothetical protein [Chloroflexota bacterium]
MTESQADPVPAPPAAEIEAAARRVVAVAMGEGLRVRLMGGLAIRIQSPSAARPPFERSYRDLDLVTHGRDAAGLRRVLEREGYVGDKLFNAIHGAQRLVYAAPDGRWSVDVVIDQLAMSHTIELKDRLATNGLTLDLADLLLSKLQIWETNRKDLGDAACLLADHPLEPVGRLVAAPDRAGSLGPIDLVRLRSVLGADWGFCHTAERNLRAIADLWDLVPIPDAPYPVDRQVAALLADIAAAPKTIGWRARARVGERVRWYETPEEARR